MPQFNSGYSPEELFTREKSNHTSLNRARVWGSTVFVLDPKLQDGKKLPKWKKRASAGMFVEFSDQYSSIQLVES